MVLCVCVQEPGLLWRFSQVTAELVQSDFVAPGSCRRGARSSVCSRRHNGRGLEPRASGCMQPAAPFPPRCVHARGREWAADLRTGGAFARDCETVSVLV
jgi:hypothetical protein